MTRASHNRVRNFGRMEIHEVPLTETRGRGFSQIFRPDQAIYREDERACSIYQVEAGGVRVYRILPSGHRHILTFHGTGEWFGLQEGKRHEDFAEAICETRLRIFPMDGVIALPVNLLTIALDNLAASNARQLVMVRQSAVARVAAFVEEIAGRNSRTAEFELMMSRTDIADYLGLTVESVARSFSKLKSRRIIRLSGPAHRLVRVLDHTRLAEISSCSCRRDPFF